MHDEHTPEHAGAAYELDPNELAAVRGGDSPIGYAIGYAVGYLAQLITEWEPYGTTPFGGMA